MRKILLLLSLCLSLSACSYLHVHRLDIQQGNIITPEMMHKIHTGMTQEQVKQVMGTPVLTNVFDKNRIDYVYTYKPGNGDMTEKFVTLIFRSGRLVQITGNIYSHYMQ